MDAFWPRVPEVDELAAPQPGWSTRLPEVLQRDEFAIVYWKHLLNASDEVTARQFGVTKSAVRHMTAQTNSVLRVRMIELDRAGLLRRSSGRRAWDENALRLATGNGPDVLEAPPNRELRRVRGTLVPRPTKQLRQGRCWYARDDDGGVWKVVIGASRNAGAANLQESRPGALTRRGQRQQVGRSK
jgi:hypothetical protein